MTKFLQLPSKLFFTGRIDRYNHELDTETEDDGEEILFQSFSSCSPRYSRVYNRGLEPLIQDVNMAFLSPYANIPPQVSILIVVILWPAWMASILSAFLVAFLYNVGWISHLSCHTFLRRWFVVTLDTRLLHVSWPVSCVTCHVFGPLEYVTPHGMQCFHGPHLLVIHILTQVCSYMPDLLDLSWLWNDLLQPLLHLSTAAHVFL